jgi:hypothetical protein
VLELRPGQSVACGGPGLFCFARPAASSAVSSKQSALGGAWGGHWPALRAVLLSPPLLLPLSLASLPLLSLPLPFLLLVLLLSLLADPSSELRFGCSHSSSCESSPLPLLAVFRLVEPVQGHGEYTLRLI